MITNYESPEFTAWWNKDHDPDETGRGRMLAANAFEAGRALGKSVTRITGGQHGNNYEVWLSSSGSEINLNDASHSPDTNPSRPLEHNSWPV